MYTPKLGVLQSHGAGVGTVSSQGGWRETGRVWPLKSQGKEVFQARGRDQQWEMPLRGQGKRRHKK